jgi:hypothetical protein
MFFILYTNGTSDGLMCDTCPLRIGKGDVNNSTPLEITDAPAVNALRLEVWSSHIEEVN